MWKSILEFSNIDISTANRWRVNRYILIEGMNILASLLFLLCFKSRVSKSFTAALVLLIASREVTTENLELIQNLVRALETNKDLTKMILIIEVCGVDARA